jgi:hypothetical protein
VTGAIAVVAGTIRGDFNKPSVKDSSNCGMHR